MRLLFPEKKKITAWLGKEETFGRACQQMPSRPLAEPECKQSAPGGFAILITCPLSVPASVSVVITSICNALLCWLMFTLVFLTIRLQPTAFSLILDFGVSILFAPFSLCVSLSRKRKLQGELDDIKYRMSCRAASPSSRPLSCHYCPVTQSMATFTYPSMQQTSFSMNSVPKDTLDKATERKHALRLLKL